MKLKALKMIGEDDKYIPIYEETEIDLENDSITEILQIVRDKWKEKYHIVQVIIDENSTIRFDRSCSGCRQGWGGVFGRIKH